MSEIRSPIGKRERQVEARRLREKRLAEERRTPAPRRQGVVLKAKPRPKFQPPKMAPGVTLEMLRGQGGYGRGWRV
jgi:hypothetical protein